MLVNALKVLSMGVLMLLSGILEAETQPKNDAVYTLARNGQKVTYATLQDAVDHVKDAAGAVIYIAPGVYREKVRINAQNVTLIGTGASAEETVIRWNDSAKNTGSTFKSGTVTVVAKHFRAENLTIANTWWDEHPAREDYSQAVALQLDSDHAVLDRVRILSGQDTLYADSQNCRSGSGEFCLADRQFFNDCFIEGNVDYIFGEAKAVFSGCELHSRPGLSVMITAQSRRSLNEDSGYTFLHCHITGRNEGNRIELGRPWREYATVTFYDTQVDQKLAPEGWQEWGDRLKTAVYREYRSHGDGVNDGHRAVVSTVLSAGDESLMTPKEILSGDDGWNPESEVGELRNLLKRMK